MVAATVALGQPQKRIAYELGLSRATVSRTLSSALTKLGCATRDEHAPVPRLLSTRWTQAEEHGPCSARPVRPVDTS